MKKKKKYVSLSKKTPKYQPGGEVYPDHGNPWDWDSYWGYERDYQASYYNQYDPPEFDPTQLPGYKPPDYYNPKTTPTKPAFDWGPASAIFGQLFEGEMGQQNMKQNDIFNPIRGFHGFNYQRGGNVNTTGYTPGFQSFNNKYNIIPSGDITMKDTPFPVVGKSLETGEIKIMKPGQKYKFKNTKNVLETPLNMNQKAIPEYQMGGAPEEVPNNFNNQEEEDFNLKGFLPFVLDDPRNTLNAGNRPIIEIQTEKGEFISSPMGDIVKVAAKKKHKNMEDDEVTDLTAEGNYVFSNDKNMFIKDNKVKSVKLEDIILGREPIHYKEGELSTSPKEYTMEEFAPKKNKYTFAEFADNISKKLPVTDRTNDPFAIRAQVENKQSRIPYLQNLIALSETKRPTTMSDPKSKFKKGGFANLASIYSPFINSTANQLEDNAITGMMFPNDPLMDSIKKKDNALKNIYAEGGNVAEKRFSERPDDIVVKSTASEGKVLREQGDPWEYQKVGDQWKTRKIGNKNWITATGLPLAAIKNRYEPEALSTTEKKTVTNYYKKETKKEPVPGTVSAAVAPTVNMDSRTMNMQPAVINQTRAATTNRGSEWENLAGYQSFMPTSAMNQNMSIPSPQIQGGQPIHKFGVTDFTGNVSPSAYEGSMITNQMLALYPWMIGVPAGNAFIHPTTKVATNWATKSATKAAQRANNYDKLFPKFQGGGPIVYDERQPKQNKREQWNYWLDQYQNKYNDFTLNTALPNEKLAFAVNLGANLGQNMYQGDNEFLYGNQYRSQLDNLANKQDRSFQSEQAYYENLPGRENSVMRQGLNAGIDPNQLVAMRSGAIGQQNQSIANLGQQRRSLTDRYGTLGLNATDMFAGRQNQQKSYMNDFTNNRLQNLAGITTQHIGNRTAIEAGNLDAQTRAQLAKQPGNNWTDFTNGLGDAINAITGLVGAFTGAKTGGGGGQQQPNGTWSGYNPFGGGSGPQFGFTNPFSNPTMSGFNTPINADPGATIGFGGNGYNLFDTSTWGRR